MKRENYIISYNGQTVIKHKWNSAIREIESIVREMAKAEGVFYSLLSSDSIKGEYGFIRGSRIWEGSNGKVLHFTIEKQ